MESLTPTTTTSRPEVADLDATSSDISHSHEPLNSTQISLANPDDSASQLKRKLAEDPETSSSSAKRIELISSPSSGITEGSSTTGDSRSTKKDAMSRFQKKIKKKGGRGDQGTPSSGWSRRGTRPDAGPSADGDNTNKAPRLPKRQSALLMGFCGSGYSGMQFQPNATTIEGELFKALVKAGAVSEDNSDDPMKVNLARAARTDAGVHAAGNVVSMKIITEVPGVDDLVARINEELPPKIRLWGILRAVNSFNARTRCDSRKYTYFFPSYLLIPPKPKAAMNSDVDPPEVMPDGLDTITDLSQKRQYRVKEETLASLRNTAKKFVGTHNFHNFTVEKDFKDRASSRYIKSIQVSDPTVYGDTEWISVLIHGQSFMLHQRKMIAALILMRRTDAPASLLDEMFGPKNVFVPKMPSLGLLLEYPIFESYNEKIDKHSRLPPSNEEYRPKILFEAHEEKMEQFKKEHIYSTMWSTEDEHGVFYEWINSIANYRGMDLCYLQKGSITEEAIIRKGEKRTAPFRENRRFDANNFDRTANAMQGVEDSGDEAIDKAKLDEMEG